MVTAKTYADVLYLSEDDALCAVSYTVPASCELPVSQGGKCLVRCLLVGEPSATPVTGGLEVRFEAEFIYLITQEQEAYFVSAAAPDQRRKISVSALRWSSAWWEKENACGILPNAVLPQ